MEKGNWKMKSKMENKNGKLKWKMENKTDPLLVYTTLPAIRRKYRRREETCCQKKEEEETGYSYQWNEALVHCTVSMILITSPAPDIRYFLKQ